ncbi:pimelyl-ACP methyl ester esterase BioV [Hydrogenimonas sp.]|uniref:pimelyl-ACP methyl ester esterase BioV n=1 Tax=Hydrogenimonas sp. TaxID=2231112 RepID=UPI002613E4FF|nr:pimelyl-ACP methyl ester esterase BioV [Hydrogenimonas sp.]
MTFFSGFSLRNEAALFEEYLGEWRQNPYVVAGFSYGAIKAAEYVSHTRKRVDRLLLLSPAYFLGRPKAFKKAQKIHYRKDPEAYLETFLKNAAFPSSLDLKPFLGPSSFEDLESLLDYPWPDTLFETLDEKGVKVETFLGGRDRIVDASAAHDFFRRHTTSYLFKPFGHLLR